MSLTIQRRSLGIGAAVPDAMSGVIVTEKYQADYIVNDAFDERNRRETRVLPYSSKKRLSPVEIEFTRRLEALQVNWEDPLDP